MKRKAGKDLGCNQQQKKRSYSMGDSAEEAEREFRKLFEDGRIVERPSVIPDAQHGLQVSVNSNK